LLLVLLRTKALFCTNRTQCSLCAASSAALCLWTLRCEQEHETIWIMIRGIALELW
jgi:hypothetical protein